MILIGQYDSPFVRRCAIALTLYGLPYTHKPWSTFGDADLIRPYNPLRRVPTLVLDDGAVIIESGAILDWADEQAGPRALIAASGDERRHALYAMALATGAADKCVAMVYEKALHDQMSDVWINRLRIQIYDVFDVLNSQCALAAGPWLFGEALNHADIALGCTVRFAREAHDDMLDATRWPALLAHADRCEALPVFVAMSQTFNPPKRR